MSENKYEWLVKKTPRSVDQLRLWPENPRLNPEETHLTLKDFAEDLTLETADKDDFYDLIKSIVKDGFVPADPVVVWKNIENDRYYVAEGNRRLTALKLLRDPEKAPKSIRSFVRNESNKIDIATIEKIYVNVAPTFEDAEWYINQRNSSSSLQRRWTRIQQQRWISTLYEKYDSDLDKVLSITKLSKSDIEGFIRILKLKDLIKLDEVKNKLTSEEYEKANSYKFPITILERLFNFSDTKERWGIDFDGIEVIIKSNKSSFYSLYSELIKRIVNDSDNKINTRINKEHLNEIFESLPEVSFEENITNITSNLQNEHNSDGSIILDNSINNNGNITNNDSNITNSGNGNPNGATQNVQPVTVQNLKNNPNRHKLVLSIYELNTDSYRLLGLFNEFKKISLTYNNTVAASIRVFLDLAVFKYIETENLEVALRTQYKDDLKNIQLKKRLEYIKINKLSGKSQNIVSRLLDPSTEYSLDVLNGFIHSQDSHYTSKKFLNSFWDFLFPLLQILLDIKEK